MCASVSCNAVLVAGLGKAGRNLLQELIQVSEDIAQQAQASGNSTQQKQRATLSDITAYLRELAKKNAGLLS